MSTHCNKYPGCGCPKKIGYFCSHCTMSLEQIQEANKKRIEKEKEDYWIEQEKTHEEKKYRFVDEERVHKKNRTHSNKKRHKRKKARNGR